ncbi:CTP synthase isoform X1 [Selaginella moellendorffii]|uniref:CTP synthase isoform X1 n=1 Tax=Selaginella moellendorffii TaxID=88036 RepID=UPI000D1C4391|nr:CTP synthase isoform X1 [Selaginella moellendorffii]|eukprot:XP_024532866.1 CTP synthase isoform X1 [Selaginella moellendorffii]
MKYVIVTGGVVSGLGKGVTASSIGVVLQSCGLRVTSIKIDPYLNTDAGTMSPFEHGEVFVLDDGGEVDLDLGNYERFLDVTLTKNNNITTGKIYQSVIDAERRGDYLGKTVQVVPHITVEIQEWIERVAVVPVDGKEGAADVCVIELGGTIGDIESSPFVEALRQFQFRVGQENFCLVHVSLIPVLGVVGEQKTKPTQHSVQALRALGLTPDLLGCRSAKPLEQCTREKLSQFCHVPAGHILSIHDVSNIWHVPLLLRDQNVHLAILKKLNLRFGRVIVRSFVANLSLLYPSSAPQPELSEWTQRAERSDALSIPVKIGMVGKYTGLSDSYLSVLKALTHASLACGRKLVIEWVASTDLEDGSPRDLHDAAWAALKSVDGILVPGGFGDRGTQGKVLAAKYARENNVPYLGVCLGMQIAVIEFARSVLGLDGANSTEFDPATPHPCVLYMPEISRTHKGGTMRLGVRRTFFQTPNCLTSKLYGNESFVDERHRHRYEVNPELVDRLEEAGLTFVGKDETGRRMEIVELPEHKYFVGVQFHPEFKSRPGKPSPVFLGLILAASKQLDSYLASGKNAGTMVTTMDNGHSFDCVANGTAEIHVNGVATKKQQQQQQADPSKFKRLERELLQIQAMVKELKEREEEIREDLRKGRGGAGDIFMED